MTLWVKIKLGILGVAVVYMLVQAWMTMGMQTKIADLEQEQGKLRDQIVQVEKNYTFLSGVYTSTVDASKNYADAQAENKQKTTALEKSFAKLESASKVKGNEQTKDASPSRDTNPTPDEWRRVLDQAYCDTNPADSNCSTGLPAN